MRLLPFRTDPLARELARAQSGDERAFERLYAELHPRVWRFVARRCRNRFDAEDVVAQTFHRLFERLDSVDPQRGSIAGYVVSIARNLLIDRARSQRDTVSVDANPNVCVAEETPLTLLLADESVRSLAAKLQGLKPEARELLVLRFVEELTHAEIAQVLGLTVAAVKQRCSRAVRELKRRSSHDEKAVA